MERYVVKEVKHWADGRSAWTVIDNGPPGDIMRGGDAHWLTRELAEQAAADYRAGRAEHPHHPARTSAVDSLANHLNRPKET